MTDLTGNVRPTKTDARANRIATISRLNDAFRKSDAGGVAAGTPVIKALGMDALAAIVMAVRDYCQRRSDSKPSGRSKSRPLLMRA